MADWFKFKNDGLDSKGMQFALSEQPLVTSVWLVILSEASKARSGDFCWADEDFELVGFARKINVSVPVFNQCLVLLERIRYIRREGGRIHIDGWQSMQSDYANGIKKGYYKNTRKKLPSDSEVSTIRGEEKRVEENKQRERGSALPEIPPMSRKAFDDLCKMRAVPEDCAEWFWNTHDGRNWTDKTGQPIRKVEPLLLNALNNWRAKQSQQSAQSQPSGKPTVFALTKIMEAKKQRADDLKSRHAIETGLDTTWNDPKARAEWKALRAEIKTLNLQMSQMA